MSRRQERSERRRREAEEQEQTGIWPGLCSRLDVGEVIPIISNAIHFDDIFSIDGDGIVGISDGDTVPNGWSISEQLADEWAKDVRFPLPESHMLARVALYDRVINQPDERASKDEYLRWLKNALLDYAMDDHDVDSETIDEQRGDINQNSFAHIAEALSYPKPIKGYANALQNLAKLRLPIYITTSPFDFLERAIREEKREPRTQICFWRNEPVNYKAESHRTDYAFEPTPENPLVYHMFGLEAYPESLVLNEDDYFDFLVTLAKDPHQEKPIVPLYIRKALTKSSLILLGYRLRDWDFRVIFRGLIATVPTGLRHFNLAIQLDPEKHERLASGEQIKAYLNKYFTDSDFEVEWDSASGFIETLWKRWDQWRR